jgi:flavin-dependent dehydrogenase
MAQGGRLAAVGAAGHALYTLFFGALGVEDHDVKDVKHDVLIIGGGPAGATAALMLARAGWSVAVVEQKTFPRRKVCGEFISATTQPLLRELGVVEAFRNRAGPEVRRVGLFAQDTLLASAMPNASSSLGQWGRALGREHLDQLLLEAAARAGATLWQPWRAADLKRHKDGMVCTITTKDDSKNLSARIAIVAQGSWERGVWPGAKGRAHRRSDLLSFKAHFRDCDLPADLMPLLVFPGGYGGMVHSDGGRVSLSCCIRRDALSSCRRRYRSAHAGDAVIQHIQTSCLGVREALSRASCDGMWLSAGPINPGIRKCYSDGIFFVGNIAGEAHPIVAEGISMAMQSSWVLAKQLVARRDDAVTPRMMSEIGTDYGVAWKDLFATRIHAAAFFAHIAMRPSTVALCLQILKKLPGMLTFGAHLSGKTHMVAS